MLLRQQPDQEERPSKNWLLSWMLQLPLSQIAVTEIGPSLCQKFPIWFLFTWMLTKVPVNPAMLPNFSFTESSFVNPKSVLLDLSMAGADDTSR